MSGNQREKPTFGEVPRVGFCVNPGPVSWLTGERSCGSRIRTDDLEVMSLASYRAAPSRGVLVVKLLSENVLRVSRVPAFSPPKEFLSVPNGSIPAIATIVPVRVRSCETPETVPPNPVRWTFQVLWTWQAKTPKIHSERPADCFKGSHFPANPSILKGVGEIALLGSFGDRCLVPRWSPAVGAVRGPYLFILVRPVSLSPPLRLSGRFGGRWGRRS